MINSITVCCYSITIAKADILEGTALTINHRILLFFGTEHDQGMDIKLVIGLVVDILTERKLSVSITLVTKTAYLMTYLTIAGTVHITTRE